jgi:hypothetical protein
VTEGRVCLACRNKHHEMCSMAWFDEPCACGCEVEVNIAPEVRAGLRAWYEEVFG